jgi:hypothetical protein
MMTGLGLDWFTGRGEAGWVELTMFGEVGQGWASRGQASCSRLKLGSRLKAQGSRLKAQSSRRSWPMASAKQTREEGHDKVGMLAEEQGFIKTYMCDVDSSTLFLSHPDSQASAIVLYHQYQYSTYSTVRVGLNTRTVYNPSLSLVGVTVTGVSDVFVRMTSVLH